LHFLRHRIIVTASVHASTIKSERHARCSTSGQREGTRDDFGFRRFDASRALDEARRTSGISAALMIAFSLLSAIVYGTRAETVRGKM